MTTYTKSTKSELKEEVKRAWYLIDAKKKVLGRLSSEIAKLLQGKHKRLYTPNVDMGDYVVVTNATKVVLTGKKPKTKTYTRYSGYPGGLKTVFFKRLIEEKSDEAIRHAVSGMLPKNKLRSKRLSRLFVFPEEKHSYKEKFASLK